MSDAYDADLDEPDEFEETEDEFEEPDEDALEEEPDQADEPDEEDEPPQRAARPARKTFAQRVDEVADRKVAALEAKLRAELAQQRPQQPTEDQQRARQARLAEMEPWERSEFLTNERLASFEAQTAERLDKQYFESLCARDPVAAKMKDQVETEIAALRARGQNVDRDTMLTFLLGQQFRKNAARATGRAAKTAAQNRERQTARPGAARSDTAPADRREATTKASRDKRLENYQL